MALASIGGGKMLQRDAAAYFLLMAQAAREAGLELVVNSAWRSPEKQASLFAQYQQALKDFIAKKRKTKPAPVAKPGKSNHEKGTAVDINRAPGDDPKTAAYDSPIDLWLAANAASFGYYRTVKVEPWHWEFTGIFPEQE
jgi:zinc D-Ala-D-Ala carboxypeptidase